MTDKETGGQAFPCLDAGGTGILQLRDGGMSLRDYFAAKAMQAILSRPGTAAPSSEYASLSYLMADAMLEAREK